MWLSILEILHVDVLGHNEAAGGFRVGMKTRRGELAELAETAAGLGLIKKALQGWERWDQWIADFPRQTGAGKSLDFPTSFYVKTWDHQKEAAARAILKGKGKAGDDGDVEMSGDDPTAAKSDGGYPDPLVRFWRFNCTSQAGANLWFSSSLPKTA